MIFCLTKPRRLKRGFFYADNLILVNLTKNLICQVVRNAQCARLTYFPFVEYRNGHWQLCQILPFFKLFYGELRCLTLKASA